MRRTVLGWIGFVGFALAAVSTAPCEAACPTTTIGVDTSLATGRDGPILGEALLQTFTAAESLLVSVTVWRPIPPDTNVFGIKLWLFGTDSLGGPDVRNILHEGPTLSIPFGDHVHPVRYDFVFDPPFVLPGPGKYGFAISADPCYGFWDVLYDASNDYGGGFASISGRTHEPCGLRLYPELHPDVDLVFEIAFCDTNTPVKPTTWGAVKAIYR